MTTMTDATYAIRLAQAVDDAIRDRIRLRAWYRHWRATWPDWLPGREKWLPDERRNDAGLRALLAARRVARQTNGRWSW